MRVLLFVLASLLLLGCGESEAERQQRELEHRERLAQIEIEQKRREMELELEQKKKERALQEAYERKQAEAEAARRRAAARAASEAAAARAARQNDRIRQGIKALKVGWRRSLMDENTLVLRLTNTKPYSVDLDLKCYTRSNSSKMLFVSVPARGTKEIGFLEGWTGNFVTGERCEAYYDDEKLGTIEVP